MQAWDWGVLDGNRRMRSLWQGAALGGRPVTFWLRSCAARALFGTEQKPVGWQGALAESFGLEIPAIDS